VGDIVNFLEYPERDTWETVGKIIEISPKHYTIEKIQFKRKGVNWSEIDDPKFQKLYEDLNNSINNLEGYLIEKLEP